jgi:hypothetical protein
MAQKPTPYDVKANKLHDFDDGYKGLARWICEEIQAAEDVRTTLEPQLDYWHRIYEQDRTRLTNNRPKPDGADLTSPLGTQYVDSLHARAMQTIFGAEPIWTVEGWADSAEKAPFVEEFHQWTAEDERVQSYVDRAIHNSWIDSEGVLEVYEETDTRPVRRTIWAQVQTIQDEMGQMRAVMGEDLKPALMRDEQNKYIEVPPPQPGQMMDGSIAQVEIDDRQPVRVGPGYRVVDLADFLILPGHARDRSDIWGYAKRFFRRYTTIKAKAKAGVYDIEACDTIGHQNEREASLDDTRRGVTIAQQDGHTAETELRELSFLRDLDRTGERWWLATVHLPTQTLLRLKHDELATLTGFGRFVRFVPFPRKNSLGGLSVIGHKIITLVEEHTAVRNMRADRAALGASAPIKVRQNALYDPDETPIGAGSVIWVRDMQEIEPMVIPDLPASVNQWESTILDGTERTMGMNDISSGVDAAEDRTLGERQMQVGASEIRINLINKRLQETMEELGQIRHAVWKRTLAEQGGMALPQSALMGIEARGLETTLIPGGKMTADLLDGKFKFKPKGSVETSDLGRQMGYFVQSLNILPALMQANPMIAAMLQTPDAARALLTEWVRVGRIQNRQAFLGAGGQMAGGTAGLLQSPEIQGILQQFGGGAPGMMPGVTPAPGGAPAPPPSNPAQGLMGAA